MIATLAKDSKFPWPQPDTYRMLRTLPVMRSSARPTSDGLHAMPAAALPIILDEKLKKVQRSLLAELDFTTWSKSTPTAPATQLALIFSTPPSAAAEIRSRLADVSHEEARKGGRAITFLSHQNLQRVRIRAEPRNQNLRGT